ncbi:hypothetical protein [Mycolicibacterium septicum]|nr:hypothetical protein [Mycolicibacterium septicum]
MTGTDALMLVVSAGAMGAADGTAAGLVTGGSAWPPGSMSRGSVG